MVLGVRKAENMAPSWREHSPTVFEVENLVWYHHNVSFTTDFHQFWCFSKAVSSLKFHDIVTPIYYCPLSLRVTKCVFWCGSWVRAYPGCFWMGFWFFWISFWYDRYFWYLSSNPFPLDTPLCRRTCHFFCWFLKKWKNTNKIWFWKLVVWILSLIQTFIFHRSYNFKMWSKKMMFWLSIKL